MEAYLVFQTWSNFLTPIFQRFTSFWICDMVVDVSQHLRMNSRSSTFMTSHKHFIGSPPQKFSHVINMNLSIYSYLNKVPRGPYDLSNMHLICVSTCRHNNRQQYIFEGQVFKVLSGGYVSISNLHGIHYCTIALSFLSKSCIMWYVVYHTLVFNEFLNNFLLLSIERM